MLRYLRIAVTALSLTACVLLIVLWVRSYWTSYSCHVSCCDQVVAIGSNNGVIYLGHTYNIHKWGGAPRWGFGSGDAVPKRQTFQWMKYSRDKTMVSVPHWFATSLIFAAATIPWLKWRFSLRTLLIATTLVAVGLGIIISTS